MSNKAKLDAAIAAAEAKYGDLPPGVLAKIAKVESNYGELLVNPKSSARGPFQFMEQTGPEFGLKDENDRLDFDKSTDAAARLTVRNKKLLEAKLGREVTAGELYLAHQQGAGGALKLLANPDKLASDIRGAQAVKLNGGDPTKTTAGEFANKWISKVDGSGGPAPQKKAEAALGGIGSLSAKDYYRYDPRSLATLNANGEKLKELNNAPRSADAPRPVEAPIARMSIGQLAGATPTVTAPGEEPPAPEMSRKDTAILLGLGTYQRMQEALPDAASVLEGVQAPITAPEGIAGVFSRSVDSGMANAAADREYFGAIIDTLTGNEKGAAQRIASARNLETEASHHTAGMESFEQFLNAPTFDGFMTQAISASGQIAPSALESIASALVGGGLFSLAKAGMSTGSKTVAKVLVKDMINKKAKGKALEETEEKILEGLYGNFKKGAVGGAFASEYVMASGGAFAEFGEGGVEMDAERALQSLLIGAPQAAIGVWGEKAIVDGLAGLALKKSTRKAGDNVLKRFAADVAGLSLKAGLTEGGTELVQESISVAQRFAIDPTYTAEDAKLRLAQATFAGFFGGGTFASAAAAPAAGIAAINRTTTGEKVLKQAKDMLGKVRESRIETEINEVTKNVTDASLSGATAPESPKDIMGQIDAVLRGESPKRAVWASEQQSSEFGVIVPGEIKIIKLTDRGDSAVYVANIPGQGNLITPDKNIAEEFMATYHVEGDMNEARRIALSYTSGKTGDNVVRVRDAEGAVISEQMTDDDGVVEAATAAEELAATIPDAQVDITDTDTALDERAARDAEYRKGKQEAGSFMQDIVDSLSDEDIEQQLKAEADAKLVETRKRNEEMFPEDQPETKIINLIADMEAAHRPVDGQEGLDEDKIVKMIDAAAADPDITTVDMKRAFQESLSSWDETGWNKDMSKWDKARIAKEWKNWGGYQAGVKPTTAAKPEEKPEEWFKLYDDEGNEVEASNLTEENGERWAQYVHPERDEYDTYRVGAGYDVDNPAAPDAVLLDGRQVGEVTTQDLTTHLSGVRIQQAMGSSEEKSKYRREAARVVHELKRRGVTTEGGVKQVTERDAEKIRIKFTPTQRSRLKQAVAGLLRQPTDAVSGKVMPIREQISALGSMADERDVSLNEFAKRVWYVELEAAWPRRGDASAQLNAMAEIMAVLAEVSDLNVMSGDTDSGVNGSMDKLRAATAKYTLKEKAGLWHLLKHLAAKGHTPKVIDLKKLYAAEGTDVPPGVMGAFSSRLNALGVREQTEASSHPPFIVMVHEIGHWAYANILTPAERAEFWKLMATYADGRKFNEAKLRKFLADEAGLGGNEATSPQEFFANQFSYWAAQRMGITEGDLLDGQPEAKGPTFREQLNKFFSNIAKQLMQSVRNMVDPNKVDPEMAKFLDKIMPLGPIPRKKKPVSPPPAKSERLIPGVTGETSTLIDSVYRAMGATDDPDGQWNEPDSTKVISLIDGAVTDDAVSEKEMKTAFKEVHDDWIEDMTGWNKAKIAEAWKDWGGWQEKVKTRDMIVNDDNEVSIDDGVDTEQDMTDIESALAAKYDEFDQSHAQVVESHKPRENDFSPEEQAEFDKDFTVMIYGIPESSGDIVKNYKSYKDRMPRSMLNTLMELTRNSPESRFDIRTSEEGRLEIVQRDESTDPETLLTRQAVRDAIEMVMNMVKVPHKSGARFRDPKTGAVTRGTHMRRDPKTRKMVEQEGELSKFSLRYKDENYVAKNSIGEQASVKALDTKLASLSGTPGRHGLFALAQAGVKLNATINRGFDGPSYTTLQKYRAGLETMIGALQIAGFELVYEPAENAQPIPIRNYRRLQGRARDEVILDVNNVPVTLGEVFGEPLPLDLSETDPDASINRQQLAESEIETKAKTVTVEGTRQIVEDARMVTRDKGTPVRKQPDAAAEFARNEDKKKNLNNVADELADSAERLEERNASLRALIEYAEEKGDISALEELIDSVPDDVIITAKKISGGNRPVYQATLTSDRFSPRTIEHYDVDWVIARAVAESLLQPDTNPIQYNSLALETTDATVAARDAHPEIQGVPAGKNQTSIKDQPGTKVDPGANIIKTFGKLGTQTAKILAIAGTKFNFHRATSVMTLDYLKANFAKLTGKGGMFARLQDTLRDTINQMEGTIDTPAVDMPGRVLMGNQNLIILRDEPTVKYDSRGDEIYSVDDAEIGAVLAHELGHIIFQQEYENVRTGTKLGEMLRAAFMTHLQQFQQEGNRVPGQYKGPKQEEIDKELAKRKQDAALSFEARESSVDAFGEEETLEQWEKRNRATENEVREDLSDNSFEEWYSDQLMAYVYNEAGKANNMVEGYFKRLAKAIKDFFEEVNVLLENRLKLFTIKERDPKTGKNHVKWSFASYMEEVSARHKANNALNNTLPVVESIMVREMALNLRNRIPTRAVGNMVRNARRIMSTGKWGSVARGALNLVHASTDFMALPAHGAAGKALSNFFGTLSQSLDALGWNKRELLQQNIFNNELADILGINEKTDPKEWDSAANRAIMLEAYNEDIPTAQLSTQQAKNIRAMYERIADTYMERPGGQGNLKYWIKGFQKRQNYGGPRMWNVDKISKNKDAFIAWLAPRLNQTSTGATATQRASDIFDTLTQHTQDQVALIARQVADDLRSRGVTNPTPAYEEMLKFEKSMTDRAVMEQRDRTMRNLRRGVLPVDDFIDALITHNGAQDVEAQALRALPADQKLAGIKKYWMKRTRQVRLTPGMDPALKRELAPEIKTIDAYNADPNDPNGWLHPPAWAHAQYMHYVARRVEFEKMGVERGAQSGAEYVIAQLDAIPEELQPQIDEAIMANLGKFGENMNSGWRLFNSVAAVWTVFTTLLFTTLSSVTDIAGIATRSKEFGNLGNFIKHMHTTLSTREFQELARSVGVVTGRTQEHMMIGQGELDHANRTSRNIMNAFFRYTGLEFYTRFVRTFAVGMGREFIVNTAGKAEFGVRETRYLAELGLTRADVQAWQAGNMDFNTPEGEKVRAAIGRFAEEAVIRPDASQRPTWASNPYLQTVWQLKSYYYGFGKTVMGGIGREIKNRHSEDGNFDGAAGTALLLGVTIFPLAMFGLASREWAKWLFQLAIPGIDEEPFRTSYMTGLEYPIEIFKRSGIMGPFALGLTTAEAFQYEGIAAPFTANIPMFDMADDFFMDGDGFRPIPVLNNIQ